MADVDELWIPLVVEPIGAIVERIQRERSDVAELVETPRRLLAFRTFAYVRVGLVLGQLLFENDLVPYDGSEAWVDSLLEEPRYREALEREVRDVAREIASDARYADEEPLGPDEEARARFREFARRQLGG